MTRTRAAPDSNLAGSPLLRSDLEPCEPIPVGAVCCAAIVGGSPAARDNAGCKSLSVREVESEVVQLSSGAVRMRGGLLLCVAGPELPSGGTVLREVIVDNLCLR